MIIKVNKSQFFDENEINMLREARRTGQTFTTRYPNIFNFETEDVTLETLLNYIDKGYGIKINCN